jgi:diadenosine tetraphosphate (Ap4A) HIT family hydrolase
MPAASIVARNRLASAIRDIAPAAPLHTLVVPRRQVASWFELSDAERRAIDALVQAQQHIIRAGDPTVAGFKHCRQYRRGCRPDDFALPSAPGAAAPG